MSSNKYSSGFVISLVSLLCGACGLFGEKPLSDRVVDYLNDNGGCLNDFGPAVEDYIIGEVSVSRWEGVFDCSIDSINLFLDFAVGSDEEGFTLDDIHSFVSKFIITDRPIPKKLVRAFFKAKASIVGGSETILTRDQIRQFIKEIQVIRNESSSLIPHLYRRANDPTPEELLALSSAIQQVAQRVAVTIPFEGNIPLEREDIFDIHSSLKELFDWDLTGEWLEVALSAKSVLLAGSPDRIEAPKWRGLIDLAGYFGGPLIAYLAAHQDLIDEPGHEYTNFITQLIQQVRPTLVLAVDNHNGAIPAKKFSRLIDQFPKDALEGNREIIKTALEIAWSRLFWSQASGSVDHNAIYVAFDLLERWNAGKVHLYELFRTQGLNETSFRKEEFHLAAEEYKKIIEPSSHGVVDRMKWLVSTFIPLFLGEDKQATLSLYNPNSLNNLNKFQTIAMIVDHMFESYSQESSDRGYLTEAELETVFAEFGDIAFEYGIVDTSVPGVHARRFREADFFMFNSNGNLKMERNEATYLVGMGQSIGTLLDRVMDDLQPICRNGDGLDPLKYEWLDAQCFREEYFGRFETYWDHFPWLAQYYRHSSDSKQLHLEQSLEYASRRYGITDLPISSYDIITFVGLMHYLETVFTRFDTNVDHRLKTKEVIAAYPVFKLMIAKIGDLDPDDDSTIEAAFTYLVHYGEAPKKNFGGIVKFLWWKFTKPFWNIKADRGDLYGIASFFNEPETPPVVF